MAAAAIETIFGEDEGDPSVDVESSGEDARRAQAETKDAERAARAEAKNEAKVARAEAKAEAKAARAEAKAAAKLERQAAAQARREARDATRAAASTAVEADPASESTVDDDGALKPLAVAAHFEDDMQAEKQRAADEERAKVEAAEAKQAAAEEKQRARAEAAEEKAKARAAAAEEKAKARAAAAEEKAKADAAKQKAREEAAATKAAEKRERDEAKATQKQLALKDKASHRADDEIVEAPREPKKSLRDRLKPSTDSQAGGADSDAASTKVLPMLAMAIGALGFVFSVILAIGAFMVALNPQDDGGLFGLVSSVCDALVGPLRGLFSFSGVNGESKEALVAWGLGALGYLVLGLFAQSFLRARSDDD